MSALLLPVTGPPATSPPPGPSGRSSQGPPTGEGFADCLGQAQSDSTKARTATAEGQTKETAAPREPVSPEADETQAAQPAPAPADAAPTPVAVAPVAATVPVAAAAPAPVEAPVAAPVAAVLTTETAAPAPAVPVMDSPLPLEALAGGKSGETPAAAGKAAAQLLPGEPLGRFVSAAAHEAHAQRAALKDAAAVTTPVAAAPPAVAPPVVQAPVAAMPATGAPVEGVAVPAEAPAQAPADAPAPAPDAPGPAQPQGVALGQDAQGDGGRPQPGSQPQATADAKPAAGTDSPLAATAKTDAATPVGTAAPQAVAREELPKATPVPLQRAAAAANELLQLAVRRNVTHARLQLSPAELGGIEVRLSYTSAGVTAQLIADAPQAAQVLERAAQDLRNALERADQTVLALDVSTRDQQQARAGSAFAGFGEDGTGRSGFGSGRGRAAREDAAEPVEGAEPVRTLSLSTGVVVDVLA